MKKKGKLSIGYLSSASSISTINRLYETNPELFEVGAEYDKGLHPDKLIKATKKWAKLLKDRRY